jgi:hypothetical protein
MPRLQKISGMSNIDQFIGERTEKMSRAMVPVVRNYEGLKLSSIQERIATVTDSTSNLIAQLRELDRLRESVRKAQLSAEEARRIDHKKKQS